MSTQVSELGPVSRSSDWRTPAVIILCGCAIGMLGFGPRSALGFFVQPMSHEFAWGRDVFGLAIAFQNLLWDSASHLPARSPIASACSV